MSSADQDHKPTIRISMANHAVPDPPTEAPYIPSEVEAKHYLYGLPSNLKGRLIARSSAEVWMKPTGPEAYLDPKELAPLGVHKLDSEIWERTVGPAMDQYLLGKQVQCTLLHPVRIGTAGQASPSPVIMIGVEHDTLSAAIGVDIAIHCHSILIDNGIGDMHVIIYESKFCRSASLYKPTITANPVAIVREPFSTTLGIPICNATTPNFEGTGGFFFVDTAKPGNLYLLTARHVLFHPDRDENKLYSFRKGTGQAKKRVMLMGTAAFEARCEAIESAIGAKELILDHLEGRLAGADKMEDREEAAAEREEVEPEIKKAKKAIVALGKLLVDVTRDWKVQENRVIGHVTLSPPITLNYGNDGFTDDWAVVQIEPSMISKLNFICNAIDLGSVDVDELTAWMYPHPANPTSFKYPIDRLLRFSGTVSDQEMFRPNPKNKDHDNDPVIMVLKKGNTSDLTVGRLNTIRAFTREYFEGKPGEMSKEVGVLPRNSKSGPFSYRGDSGSVVIDGKGRVCGILTGGDGATDVSDCTYVTSINFLIKRLADYKIKANIFPLPADL